MEATDPTETHKRTVETIRFLTHRFGGFWLKRVLVDLFKLLAKESKGDARSALQSMGVESIGEGCSDDDQES